MVTHPSLPPPPSRPPAYRIHPSLANLRSPPPCRTRMLYLPQPAVGVPGSGHQIVYPIGRSHAVVIDCPPILCTMKHRAAWLQLPPLLRGRSCHKAVISTPTNQYPDFGCHITFQYASVIAQSFPTANPVRPVCHLYLHTDNRASDICHAHAILHATL